jgi:hypothetical protein
MVFHGIPILVCENINPSPAAVRHLLYTVYPAHNTTSGLLHRPENTRQKKGGEEFTGRAEASPAADGHSSIHHSGARPVRA